MGVEAIRISQGKLRKFAQVAGLRGLNIRIDRAAVDPDTVFDVSLVNGQAEIAVNDGAMLSELTGGSRKIQVGRKELARALDKNLRLELFKIALSEKWRDVRERGVATLGGAVGSLARAAVFLMDDRRLITARKQPA